METGYVLAWIVGVSSGLSLVLALGRAGPRQVGWLAVHGTVLSVLLGVSLLVSLNAGGKVAAGVWFPTVLIPTLLARRLPVWLRDRRFDRARIAARVLRALHPADGWEFQLDAVNALAAIDAGELIRAKRIIDALPSGRPLWRSLTAQHFRAAGDFVGAAQWLESLPRSVRLESNVVALEARVAGELGDMPRLKHAVDRAQTLYVAPADAASAALMLTAFGGAVSLTDELLAQAFPALPTEAAEFWRATAEQRAGVDARARLESLGQSSHPVTRAAAQRRLHSPLSPVTDPPDLAAVRMGLRGGRYRPLEPVRPTATYGLCALLLAAFALELPGGTESTANLFHLGALTVPMLPGHEWRILTAGLYHFGWLHLTLNVLGIALLGRQVEARLGHLWTFATFWVSSIGAMSILAATVPAGTPPGIVVGASGGLMGILGAVIGGVAVRYAKERRRPDRRQLVVLLFIVAFQVIFDAATPQVSGAVHLYGLAIGTGVGVFATVARSRSQSVKASA